MKTPVPLQHLHDLLGEAIPPLPVFSLYLHLLHAKDHILPRLVAFYMSDLVPFWIVIRFFSHQPYLSSL